jgi:hypothetical protein
VNQQRITPQVAADDFNHCIAVGDWIRYREIKGEGEGTLYRTKTKASVLGGHSAVVWLEGKSGCVCCDHCDVVPQEEVVTVQAMGEQERAVTTKGHWLEGSSPEETLAMLRGTAKPPADYLLASVKHSYTGDPLVAWWRPEARGYTTSVSEAGTFTKTQALANEYSSNATVAIPLSDLGHRLIADESGDRYPFSDGNKALLELLLATSCNRRFTRPDR